MYYLFWKEDNVKKITIIFLLFLGVVSLSAKKEKKEIEIPNIEVQMEKADKIESYKAKKDLAWHKTEYNKVLKYLNKSRK